MKPKPVLHLTKVRNYVPGKPIEEVRRELRLKNIYKLASNENPFGFSPRIIRKLPQIIKDINRYPEPSCYYLREALAKKLRVKGNQIVFGNGSDELIVLTLRCFLNAGDEVIMAEPTFLVYPIQSQVEGAKICAVKLKGFRYDLAGMLKKINRKTRIIFIANPDNPTGAYINKKELRDFLMRVPENIVVFLDEAYYEYASLNTDYPQTLPFLRQRKNIIVSRTFSKAYGLAGLRVGYGITTPEIAEAFNKAREPFNVNSVAQKCALIALEDRTFVRKVIYITQKEKEFLYGEFTRMNLRFLRTATNFIPVKVGRNSGKIYEVLLHKGVIVRNLDFWGLKGFLRVTVGTPQENRIFIRTLKKVLKSFHNR